MPSSPAEATRAHYGPLTLERMQSAGVGARRRELRRRRRIISTSEGWELWSTNTEYLHVIELVPDRQSGELIPMCVATRRPGEQPRRLFDRECRAPYRFGCWAAERVAAMLERKQ